MSAKHRRYNRKKPWVPAEAKAWYRAKVLGRIPPWAHDERASIKIMYKLAHDLTQETGRPHEVDHVVPLKLIEDLNLEDGPACGLHCLDNIEVIERKENRQVWSITEGKPIWLRDRLRRKQESEASQ